jgi:histidine triad (HIT) family protein
MNECIFCSIVCGEVPSYTVWEDDVFVAFLSLFPNTPGVTVVIPKKHISSYIFDAEDTIIAQLMVASKKVALKIDRAFEDVGRTGVIFEGFGVDHLHAKLFPMHKTGNMKEWRPLESIRKEYYTEYPGFLSSHDGKREKEEVLEKIAQKIRMCEV